MTRHYGFTLQDDECIKQCVINNPTNLLIAFKEASHLIAKSPQNVQTRWYKYLRNGENIIHTGSSKGYKSNTKNTNRIDGVMPKVELQPYLVVLQELLKLSKKERDAIVNLLILTKKN